MSIRANMTNRSKEPRNNLSSTTSGHTCADSWVPTGLIHVPDSENELAVLVEEQEHRHRGLDSPSPFQDRGRNPHQTIAAVVCRIHLSHGWSGKAMQELALHPLLYIS